MVDFNDRYQQLLTRYAESLPQKLSEITAAWTELRANPRSTVARDQLRQRAHKLSGSAAAYGFEQIGKPARLLDTRLARWLAAPLEEPPTDAGVLAALEDDVNALCCALAKGECVTEASSMPRSQKRSQLVLVEDDLEQAQAIAATLTGYGYEVTSVAGSAELWPLLRARSVDLIILDYWLVGETASEIATRLKREPDYANLPIVCFSIESKSEILRGALDAGCELALSKKIPPAEFAELVRSCLAAYAPSQH
jgi:CheY-like chemotaxis protein